MEAVTIIIYTIVIFCIGYATCKSFILSELRRTGKTTVGECRVCVDSPEGNRKPPPPPPRH